MTSEQLNLIQTPVHPSKTISSIIKARGMDTQEFLEKAGIDADVFNNFMKCEIGVTKKMAEKLAAFLGTSSECWLNIQKGYELQLEKFNEKFESETDNFNKLDYSFFSNLGLVKKSRFEIDMYKRLLRFFNVNCLEDVAKEDLAIAYKSSANEEKELICANAWVKTALYLANRISVSPYDANKLISIIPEIREMTLQMPEDFLPRLKELFNQSGVAFVVLPTLENSKVNGAVKWMSNDKVLLAVNDNGQFADKFWFAIFHEIKHILQEKHTQTFVSMEEKEPYSAIDDELEKEADDFARSTLIPSKDYDNFLKAGNFNIDSISEFSNIIGVDDCIVIGRLQHDGHIGDKEFDEVRTEYYISCTHK